MAITKQQYQKALNKAKSKRYEVKVHDKYDRQRKRTIDLMADSKSDAYKKAKKAYANLVIDNIKEIKSK